MGETTWLALLAVVGTVLGASISPLIAAWRDIQTMKDSSKSERLRAAAAVAEGFVVFARINSATNNPLATERRRLVTKARFDLAKYLPRGAGQADRFIEHTIEMIASREEIRDRAKVGEFGAASLMAWARGDLPAQKLYLFEVVENGNFGIEIV